MAKRKAQHKQQRNVVFMDMMQLFGGKSVGHKSKKDYRRQPKHRAATNEKGWDSQPFLFQNITHLSCAQFYLSNDVKVVL